MEHFKRYFLLYTVLPLLLLSLAASYFRFMVIYDYQVTFEGFCDPYSESCFEYCEDEECVEPFHYTWFTRSAAGLQNSCSELSILDCELAEECEVGEECGAVYCDPSVDEDCEFLTEDDKPFDLEFEELLEESI